MLCEFQVKILDFIGFLYLYMYDDDDDSLPEGRFIGFLRHLGMR